MLAEVGRGFAVVGSLGDSRVGARRVLAGGVRERQQRFYRWLNEPDKPDFRQHPYQLHSERRYSIGYDSECIGVR